MAIVRAVKSGNWSDTTVWNTGALPTSADDVYSNTFTVTIDQSATVLQISNAAATGVTAGGGFTMSAGGFTLTANVNASGAVDCLTVSVGSGATATVVGNIQAGSAGRGINLSGTGTLNVTGNITGGSGNLGYGVNNNTTGTINVTGNTTGGSGLNSHGCYNSAGGTIVITGTATGGTNSSLAAGALNASGGTLSHVGIAQASTTSAAIGPGTVSQNTILTGPLISTDAAPAGASASGVSPCTALRWFPADTALSTFEFRMRGQTLSGSPSIRPARSLYLTDAYAATYPSATNVRSGTGYGPGNVYTGTCAVPGASSVLSGVPVDNTTGTATISAADIRAAIGLASANLDTQLSGLSSGQTTINNNVSTRLASSAYTAPLDATGTRTALGLASANLDTQFNNIPANVRTNLSTELGRIDTTVSSRLASASYQTPLDASGTRAAIGLASANLDTQLSSLPNLDTTVSSRLASLDYTTPPTSEQNAQAVRTELATELGRIDVATSTRSTFNPAIDTVAQVTLVDTTTNLTNPPDVPTTTEIAEAVRVELTPELDRIDADVSSRLAFVDYTTPPTSLENAQAVRTELTPELNRIDADVSSRLAFVDYTVPPTALQNAEAVEVQLALPLGNLDVAVSSRSTFNPATDTVANVTLVDTTTNLTNPPVVPTTTEIADAVRVELTPELDRIDVDVSSRLSSASYTEPPSPEQNAIAVRDELSPELERVANCATVATTGEQIQDAWARSPSTP